MKKNFDCTDSNEKGYHCPMYCEEFKVYNHQGYCPICNLKLVELTDKSKRRNIEDDN